MPGTLFVVATPIGNLEDLTFRALRTLREVDLIAAEDTRRTSKLLAHYEIRKPLMSLREHNEARETPRLVGRLLAGGTIALVSDAGTPGIADPGARLVRSAREAAVVVIPIPGPSAISAALSASGFPADQFRFAGFPPSKGAERQRWFDEVSNERQVVVFFEAPHRIQRTMAEIFVKLVNRPIVVWREITKIHEVSVEYTNQRPASTTDQANSKGEFTVVVGPDQTIARRPDAVTSGVVELFGLMTQLKRPTRNEAIRSIASGLNCDIREVKRLVKSHNMYVK
jgi:16S rRNA (cytidine1402-2'-O)-methyltransferase